ncbi:MAG TPA: DUF167 domain-containing protein [Candidatus Paceibacterota bacterium]|nr:DUF167 domain-containing protein [Candidatus Paceibacterota bacterium]
MKIFIKTKPQSKNVGVEKIDDTHFVVCVKEPPEKGKANEGVRKALAEYFGVTRSSVVILAGHTAKNKIVEISSL